MSDEDTTTTEERSLGRDVSYWAKPVAKLTVGAMPKEAADLVGGKRLVGPVQGFGKMWQKTYRVRLEGASVGPTEVIRTWKEHFPEFWPAGNRFYAPLTGIAPGEVALLRVSIAGPVKLSTGVMVLYADDESFTLMTPQGHMFAGWITFSAHREGDATVAQAQILMRAQDPLIEVGLMLGGHRNEDRFWQRTLRALAAHFGVQAEAETQVICVDPRWQWSRVTNVWHNAGVRNSLHAVLAPIRRLSKTLRR